MSFSFLSLVFFLQLWFCGGFEGSRVGGDSKGRTEREGKGGKEREEGGKRTGELSIHLYKGTAGSSD